MKTENCSSGHSCHSYRAAQSPSGPFGRPLEISAHGPISFAPQMRGMFSSPSSSGTQISSVSDNSFVEMTEDSAMKIAAMQSKLDKKLGPEYISQRPGPGGGPKLTYAEGWKIINLANEVFGFNGWSSSIVSINTDFIDYTEETRRYSVGVTAIVRVTLRDGAFHEDVGYGLLENSKSKGAALDKCKKEAVTDAIKRTLRNFGNLLGNCLYDKSYTQEVIKMKVPPPKFDRGNLHRRPEFEEPKPDVFASSSASAGSLTPGVHAVDTSIVKSEPILSSMPPPAHIPPRRLAPLPNATSTPNTKGKLTPTSTGLQTPLQTPSPVQGRSTNAPARHNQNEGGMAQKTADRHAARLQAIRDAQDAIRCENEATRATATSSSSTTPGPPAPASGSTAAQLPQTVPSKAVDDEDDAYFFPSEDDEMLANLDLDTLDEGIGRPIDFDEGQGAATETNPGDIIMHSAGASTTVGITGQCNGHQTGPSVPVPQSEQQRTQAATTASYGTANSSVRLPTSHPSRPQNQNVPSARHIPSNSSSTSTSERPRTPSMGGGFSYPNGQSQTTAAPPCVQSHAPPRGTASNGGSLKRTADIMQGIAAGLASRRPQQGMGLQNLPPGSGQQAPSGSMKREPLAALQLGEGGDVKRVRRQ